MKTRWGRGIVTALWLTTPVTLAVAAAPSPPAARVTETLSAIHRAAEPPGTLAPALRRMLVEFLDTEELVRGAIGASQAALAPTAHPAFRAQTQRLVVEAYVAAVRRAGVLVGVVAEGLDGDRALVRTEHRTPEGRRAIVEHRLAGGPQHWRVVEVAVDGVNLAADLRPRLMRP